MKANKVEILIITLLVVASFVFTAPIFSGHPTMSLNQKVAGGTPNNTLTMESSLSSFNNTSFRIQGLNDPVTVLIDQSGLAHIIALNNHDLFFAQGYYTASQRLFQMELEALSVSGNFSNYIGSAGLSSDISARLQGIPEHAYQLDQTYKTMYPTYYSYLKAYASGVNAYINKTLSKPPIEFGLFGFAPVQWKVIYTLDWEETMAFSLMNGKGNAIRNDLFANTFGIANTTLLWPDYPYFTHNITVVPGNGTVNGYNLTDQGISPSYLWSQNWYGQWATGVNLSLIKNITPLLNTANGNDPYLHLFQHELYQSFSGSNEWIVTANYSATGKPILENDPHLGLSLPTLFLPMQLRDPSFNVTGWELVDLPGILIGHTQYTSWGLTTPGGYNANEYLEILNGSSYLYNGSWYPIRESNYTLLGHTYTVNYTNMGPLFAQGSKFGISFNWAGNNASLDFVAELLLDQSTSYQTMLSALKYWASPPQNFALVSLTNAGIITAGKFPLIKETLPDGKTVKVIGSQSLLNGSMAQYSPDGFVPFQYLPQIKNPIRGFAFAPNQPLAGLDYPYPLVAEAGGTGGRAHTINSYLSAHPGITVQNMIKLQANVSDSFAAMLTPLLLKALNGTAMNSTETAAYHSLESWNYTDYTGEIGPTVYWYLKMEVLNMSFEQIYQSHSFSSEGIPTVTTLIYLAEKQPDSPWLNGNFTTLVRQAFPLAITFLEQNIGKNESTWTWGTVHEIEFPNLFGLPANYGPIPFKGGSHTVSVAGVPSIDFHVPLSTATTSSVVKEISSPASGLFLGVFPGGPSENFSSPYYDNQLQYWLTDQYYNMSSQATVYTMVYEPENYTLTFTETGLPSGTEWYVNGTGMFGHENSPTNITFTLNNGTYTFTVTNLSSYYTTTSHFTVHINGNNVTETVHYYQWAYITGTISPGNATLTINGNSVSVSSSGHFNVSVANGTYHVVAFESGYTTYYNNFTLNTGGVKNLTIDLKTISKPSSVSSSEIYAIIGAVVAIAAVAGVIGFMRRRH